MRLGAHAPTPSEWLLAFVIFGSALAVGTVHTVSLCVVATLLSLAVASAWWGGEPFRARPTASVLLFTAVGLTLYTAFQCIPLPVSWLARISPVAAEVWSRALSPLREACPRWAPLSVDPTATRIEVLKGVAYVLAFVAAIRSTRSRDGTSFVAVVVVATGLALALAALLHPALGLTRLYGLYTPDDPIASGHLAPLLDPNHLAGYLNLSFCLCVSAATARIPRFDRAWPTAAAAFLAMVQIWNASRAGVAAMVVGGILVVLLNRRAGQQGGRTSWFALVSGGAVIVGAALVGYGASERVKSELLDPDATKLAVAFGALRVVQAYPLFGVGRGAFESAFPRFRPWAGHLTFSNPENFLVQWLTEWGVPVSLCALVAIGYALRPSSAGTRSSISAGAWAGLVALGLQNLADFSSEIPGVVIAGVVCAAIVTGGSAGKKPRIFERWPEFSRSLAVGAVLTTLLTVVPALNGVQGELRADRLGLHDAAVVQKTPLEDFRNLARAAMLRHPAEPYLPFAGGLRAFEVRDDSPLRWLGATLERAETYGPAHYLLARTIGGRAPAQARMELRLAAEQDPVLVTKAASEGASLVGSYDDAIDLVPSGKEGVVTLLVLQGRLAKRLPATAERLVHSVLDRDPSRGEGWLQLGYDGLVDLQLGNAAPWCTGAVRTSCLAATLDVIGRWQSVEPGTCEPLKYRALAITYAGNAKDALNELEAAADSTRDREVCLEAVVSIAESSGNPERAAGGLDKIIHTSCATDAACLRGLRFAADHFERLGHLRESVAAFERARSYAPDDEGLLIKQAQLAGSAGEHAKAADAFGELARRHPEDRRWSDAEHAEHAAQLRDVEGL